jgi:hypothetical protein
MTKVYGVVGLCFLVAGSFAIPSLLAQEEQPQYTAEHMQEMMAKAKKVVEPGERHKALERFIGEWDTETRFFMGGKPAPPENGSSKVEWLMAGRWIKSESRGTMMGRPAHSFMIMGYDNFKMSYVTSMVSTFDTAMLHSEGDLAQDGNTLITYGTLDEYLTGEHDKMVKYVWRLVSDDKVVMEVHDLPIGETNTKVIEVVSTRKK